MRKNSSFSRLPNYANAPAIIVDTETRDPEIQKRGAGWATNNGFLIGVAVGILGDPASTRYFPTRHEDGDNEDEDQVNQLLNRLGKMPIPKIGFNIGYDIGWMNAHPLVNFRGPFIDVMNAAALIDERRTSYSLENVGQWLVGRGKKTSVLEKYAAEHGLDPKQDMVKMPARLVGEYACEDVDLTGDSYSAALKEIQKQQLESIFELENELIWVFYLMRKEGIRIDEDKLSNLTALFSRHEQECIDRISTEFGYAVDPWAARSIEKMCLGLGVPYLRTAPTKNFPNGNPSFTADFLDLAAHPALQLVAEARRYSKAGNTFLQGLQSYVHKGKIHAEFHQLKSDDGGTVTGRISVSHPGLQQMPARDKEMAKAIRGLFIASHHKRKMGSADYSQQEPRLQLHYASLLGLPGAETAVHTFRENPRTDYHQMTADITHQPRSVAKIINLGLAYGMGVKKLARSLGVAETDAAVMLANYYRELPWLRDLQKTCGNKAADRGWIKTLLGRRCRYKQWEPVNKRLMEPGQYPMELEDAHATWPDVPLKRAFTYRGMNGLIQGSAGDQTKKAMRDLYYDHKVLPVLQMHDELLFEVSNKAELERYAQVMRDCVKLAVPVVVDTAVGASWGEVT